MTLSSIETQVQTALAILEGQSLLESGTVVLIGSAVRGSTHAGSDIDILLILPSKAGLIPLPYEIDARVLGRTEFLERLERSDDLACWAIRYGRVLSDRSRWWSSVAGSSTYSAAWPDWKPKISQAARRLINSIELAETGDLDAAWEECALAASHVARALLLRAGIFPLSRMELVGQLTEVGFLHLAHALNKLVVGNGGHRELSKFTSYVKIWLASLSSTNASPEGRSRLDVLLRRHPRQ